MQKNLLQGGWRKKLQEPDSAILATHLLCVAIVSA
jgi:hypothetical protein